MTKSSIILSGLCIYPIKSAAGLALRVADLNDRGLALDRRWMLVDRFRRTLGQRQCPALRLVTVSPRPDGGLRVSGPQMSSPLDLPPEADGAPLEATMWGQHIAVRLVSAEASAWFSEALGLPCDLVQQPRDARRLRKDQPDGVLLALSDGNPLHLVNEASIDDLNARLVRPIDFWRFRPNLVVRGAPPYAEDHWRRLRIAGVDFDVIESTARCVVVNVDERGQGAGTVLRTLAGYRRWGRYIPFGQHLNHRQLGTLHVGDAVEVLEVADEPNPSG